MNDDYVLAGSEEGCVPVDAEWKKKYGRREENNEARYVQFHIPVINSKSLSNEMRSYTNSLFFILERSRGPSIKGNLLLASPRSHERMATFWQFGGKRICINYFVGNAQKRPTTLE